MIEYRILFSLFKLPALSVTGTPDLREESTPVYKCYLCTLIIQNVFLRKLAHIQRMSRDHCSPQWGNQQVRANPFFLCVPIAKNVPCVSETLNKQILKFSGNTLITVPILSSVTSSITENRTHKFPYSVIFMPKSQQLWRTQIHLSSAGGCENQQIFLKGSLVLYSNLFHM